MIPFISGVHGDYFWIEWSEQRFIDVLYRFPELLIGNYLVITSLGGTVPDLELNAFSDGWYYVGGLLCSPQISDVWTVPYDDFDEWYIFSKIVLREPFDIFVLDPDFTLQVSATTPPRIENHQARLELQYHFWQQIERTRPIAYLASGYRSVYVTHNKPLFETVQAWFSQQRRTSPLELEQLEQQRDTQALLAALRHEDSALRAKAATLLGQFGDAQVFAPLAHAVHDYDQEVRYAALTALGNLGDERAVSVCATLLTQQDWWLRFRCLEVLAQFSGSQARQVLMGALRDPTAAVRRKAAEELGRLGDPRAVEPLIEACADRDATVLSAIVAALAQIGAAQVREKLLALWQTDILVTTGGSLNVYISLARAFGQLGQPEPLLDALSSNRWQAAWPVRVIIIQVLGQMREQRATPLLVAALADQTVQGAVYPVRLEAEHALRSIWGTEAEEWLKQA